MVLETSQSSQRWLRPPCNVERRCLVESLNVGGSICSFVLWLRMFVGLHKWLTQQEREAMVKPGLIAFIHKSTVFVVIEMQLLKRLMDGYLEGLDKHSKLDAHDRNAAVFYERRQSSAACELICLES